MSIRCAFASDCDHPTAPRAVLLVLEVPFLAQRMMASRANVRLLYHTSHLLRKLSLVSEYLKVESGDAIDLPDEVAFDSALYIEIMNSVSTFVNRAPFESRKFLPNQSV